jgi:predicted Fe-Mo cluster-binding NifX family protein
VKEVKMKIVIPTEGKEGENSVVSEHFGRCNTYTFLDEKGKVVEIIDNTSEHMGGTGLPPELMKKHGANILLCQGLGPRALGMCKDLGIEVYVGRANTVKEIFDKWNSKKINKATDEDICKEHQH